MQDDQSTHGERRQPNESPRGEQRETIEEMSALLTIVQRMGHRLSYETHSTDYDMVYDLNQILHQARMQLEKIQKSITRE